MTIRENYEQWLRDFAGDPETVRELEAIRDARRKPCDRPFYGCPESEYVRCGAYVPPEERYKENE